MIKKSNRCKIWYILIFALYMFPLRLKGTLLYISYAYVYAFPLVYILININYVMCQFKHTNDIAIQFFKLSMLFLLNISLLTPLVHQSFDFSYIFKNWKDLVLWMIKYLFLICIFEKHVDNTGNLKLFTDCFTKAVSLYVIFSLMSTYTPFRNVLMKILYLSESDLVNYERGEYWTRFGWSGWSGFNETALCTVAVILNGVLFLSERSKKKQVKRMFAVLFPIIGNALYGRIGLLASIVFLTMITLIIISGGEVRKLLKILILGIIGLISILLAKENISVLKNWTNWVFSAFDNYKKYGRFYDNMGTIEHLVNDMYWIPGTETLLFGDGIYTGTDGLYYMHTDSGIMRSILYFGIINYLIYMSTTISLIYSFVVALKKKYHVNNKYLLVFSIFIIIIIFEYKGEALWMFIPIILSVTLLLNANKKIKQSIIYYPSYARDGVE